MKRMLRTGALALLLATLLLPTLSATAAPATDGWSLSLVMEWLGSRLLPDGIAAAGSESTAEGVPTVPASDPGNEPVHTSPNPTEPVEDGGDTESHPYIDPNG